MKITYDPEKRAWTLRYRELDFKDAQQVFAGATLTVADDRLDYGEPRFQTLGILHDRLTMVVWTPREEARHLISMRRASARERKKYQAQMG